ncbi:MAG TPA: hypothetical protein VKB93_14050 [Thermoanaerobaculia bacterium]|nr:hypothetical protein [Thermoanaerobaculia bacterium]
MSLIAAIVLVAASQRNPFQFVEPPPAKPKDRGAAAFRPPENAGGLKPAAPSVVETAPVIPPPPAFPYQLIGRFGRGENLIVAFSGKGQVITAQVGDTIEDTFVIRGIGVDSVEIGYVNRPETVRLQL